MEWVNSTLRERDKALRYALFIPIPGIGMIFTLRWKTAVFYIVFFLFLVISLFSVGYVFIPFFLVLYLLILLFSLYDTFHGSSFYKSPCEFNCPINNNPIEDIVLLIAEKRFQDAEDLSVNIIPFPHILCMLCTGYCVNACVRKEFDESIRVKTLLSAIKANGKIYMPHIKHREKIGIVGGGIAGLSFAFYMRKKGYSVSLIEKTDELLGKIGKYVPSFAMPYAYILDALKRIEEWDINIKYNTSLGEDILLSDFVKQHDIVVIATGKDKIENEGNIENAIDVRDFLLNISKYLFKDEKNKGSVIVYDEYDIFFGIYAVRYMVRLGYNEVYLYLSTSITLENAIEKKLIEENIRIVKYDTISKEEFLYYDIVVETNKRKYGEYGIKRLNNFHTNINNVFYLPETIKIADTVQNAFILSNNISSKLDPLHHLKNNVRIYPVIYKIPNAAWNYSIPKKENSLKYMRKSKNITNNFHYEYLMPSKEEMIKESLRCMLCHRRYH